MAALSQCHLLWYLHLCAEAGVVVTAYDDEAVGVMVEAGDGGGHFEQVTLRPHVTVAAEHMARDAADVHERAAAKCFIAASVNFPVRHEVTIDVRSVSMDTGI